MYKKVIGCIFLSLPGVKLGGSKHCHLWNILLYWNGKVDSHYSLTLLKLPLLLKTASNKNYRAGNCVQNNPQLHMSISLRSRKGVPKIAIFEILYGNHSGAFFFKKFDIDNIDIFKIIPEYSIFTVDCVEVEWIFLVFSNILE